MNLLRISILLRVTRILQQFPGLAWRAGAQAVGSRGFHAITDDLLLGDLFEVEGRLDGLVIAVHRRWGVSRWGASGWGVGVLLVVRLDRVDLLLLLLLQHLLRPLSLFRGQTACLRVSLQPVPGLGPGQLPLHVLLQVVLLPLGDHFVQHDQEYAEHDGEQTYCDQLVPPTARRFRAPTGEIARQKAAH